MSNFVKIRPVRGELFHADGRTDRLTDRHDDAISRCWQILRTPLKSTPHKFCNYVLLL